MAEGLVAIQRINKFMNLDETYCGDPEPLHPDPENTNLKDVKYYYQFHEEENPRARIALKNATVEINRHITLKDINFTALPGTLTVIVGELGSGKSTLLKLIINELRASQGYVETRGFVSYASEDVWLFSGNQT